MNLVINTTFPNMSLIDSSNVQCQETKELDWSAILMMFELIKYFNFITVINVRI